MRSDLYPSGIWKHYETFRNDMTQIGGRGRGGYQFCDTSTKAKGLEVVEVEGVKKPEIM